MEKARVYCLVVLVCVILFQGIAHARGCRRKCRKDVHSCCCQHVVIHTKKSAPTGAGTPAVPTIISSFYSSESQNIGDSIILESVSATNSRAVRSICNRYFTVSVDGYYRLSYMATVHTTEDVDADTGLGLCIKDENGAIVPGTLVTSIQALEANSYMPVYGQAIVKLLRTKHYQLETIPYQGALNLEIITPPLGANSASLSIELVGIDPQPYYGDNDEAQSLLNSAQAN